MKFRKLKTRQGLKAKWWGRLAKVNSISRLGNQITHRYIDNFNRQLIEISGKQIDSKISLDSSGDKLQKSHPGSKFLGVRHYFSGIGA